MSAESVDLEPLRQAIRQYKMMELWADSIQIIPEVEKSARAKRRALEAKETYLRLMTSPRNSGSTDYREWAILKALGLSTSKRYTAQPTGGKNWRAWGRDENAEDIIGPEDDSAL